MSTSHLPLFGGVRAWTPKEWTSSDDRVRGGSSISNLSCSPSSLLAKFHGTLDIKTLGGAGFASQRTTGTDRTWDLSAYDGLEIILGPGDGKTYTLTLKDEILPKRPDGRESSSISWEYDFRADERGSSLFIKWADLRATYRGRNVDDVRPLDLKGVKRFGIMIRSFFGDQEGEFELGILSISALRMGRYKDDPEEMGEEFDEKVEMNRDERRSGFFSWLTSCLGLRS